MEKSVKCPVCGTESKIISEKVDPISGMFEVVDGYTCGKFKCPGCGLESYSGFGNEMDDLKIREKEVEDDLNNIKFEISDFRTARKHQILGTLLLRKMGSYGTSLKDAVTWLQNIKK